MFGFIDCTCTISRVYSSKMSEISFIRSSCWRPRAAFNSNILKFNLNGIKWSDQFLIWLNHSMHFCFFLVFSDGNYDYIIIEVNLKIVMKQDSLQISPCRWHLHLLVWFSHNVLVQRLNLWRPTVLRVFLSEGDLDLLIFFWTTDRLILPFN